MLPDYMIQISQIYIIFDCNFISLDSILPDPLRILIAEDDAVISLLLQDVVECIGLSVCDVVGTEAEAVAAAIHHKPDLIIVDAGLGDGSGVAAMRAILSVQAVPHIFVTGNKQQVREQAPESVILEKPFFVPELAAAIEAALAQAPRK